jgi:hypothetical protein
MKTATPSVLAIALGLVVVGCGHEGTPATSTAPTSATSPAPSGFGTVRIVSGPDGTPVVGASVTFEGDDEAPALSGPSGEASPADWMLATYGRAIGTAVDVDARGFLPRRTRVPDDRVITLWPVADEAEAEAVREMVYGTQGTRNPTARGSIAVVLDFLGEWDEATARAWGNEASAFGASFDVPYTLGDASDYACPWECAGSNMIFVHFAETGFCHAPASRGFCLEPSSTPQARGITVRPGSARDTRTIRGVLASWFLGPNPLPGLMNPENPASALSPLETQTIRMLLLRRLPNRWPDTDR